jgi:hypothetical protein
MHRIIISAVIAFAVAWTASTLLAADAAATARRGDHYYVATAKTQNIHANDHVRLLGKYAAASVEPVPAAVVKHHLDAIRANTQLAGKAYGKLSTPAKQNLAVSKQLAEINARLAKVNELVDQLEKQSKDEAIESKAVIAKTNALSQELRATHLANKAIDQAFVQDEQQAEQFTNPDSSDYYFTGEGHFID